MGRSLRLIGLAGLVLPLGVFQATVARALTQPVDSFVAAEATPYHDGLVSSDALTPPLSGLWKADFTIDRNVKTRTYVESTLVVGNQVFASVHDSGGGHVYALSLATGGLLWGPAGTGGPLAYDAGEVFGISQLSTYPTSVAYALDAMTGHQLWSTNLVGQGDYGEPTASNGTLYAQGDAMMALDERSGAPRWQSDWEVGTGTEDNVTVTDGALFFAGACDDFYAVKASDGSTLWRHPGRCTSGGGTGSLAFHDGLLYGGTYVYGSQGLVIDAANGNQVGTYPNNAQLAIDGGTAFWDESGSLQAFDLSTKTVAWTFAGAATVTVTAGVVACTQLVAVAPTEL